MRVTQKYMDVTQAAANPHTVDSGFSIGMTLVEDRDLRQPLVTDFGPQSTKSLVLFAKDLDTIIRGLSAFNGRKSVILNGPVSAIPLIFGDTSRQQNVTGQYIKGKLDNVGNNLKGLLVRGAVKLDKARNLGGNGTPQARKFADKIGFNAHLWHEGSKDYTDTKDIVRDTNLSKGHALVYLIPAGWRAHFNHAQVCAIEGRAQTSLAAVGKLLRTVKL